MPATRAMFQPLMATTWVRPVVVKSSLTERCHTLTEAHQDAGGETRLGLGERLARGRRRWPGGDAPRRPWRFPSPARRSSSVAVSVPTAPRAARKPANPGASPGGASSEPSTTDAIPGHEAGWRGSQA